MKLICINGQGGVGKDTFVSYCGYEEDGIYNFSMVDGVKRVAQSLGWTGGKELKDRKFLSDLKDLSSDYSDFPFSFTLENIQTTINNYKHYNKTTDNIICFIHTREPKDIKRWVDEYDAKTLLIRRESVEGSYGNHADDSVFDVDYDYIIENNGSLYVLKEKANLFINKIRNENWESNIWKK